MQRTPVPSRSYKKALSFNSGTPAGTSTAVAQSTKGMENVTVHRQRNMKGKEMHSDVGPEPDRSEFPAASFSHKQKIAYQRIQNDNNILRASLQQLQKEIERLQQQASLNTFPDIPPSPSHRMPPQASGSPDDPKIYPSIETDTRSNQGRRKKSKQRRNTEHNPHSQAAPPALSSEPSESGGSNSGSRRSRPARKRNATRFNPVSHDLTPSPISTYIIKPTNLTNKLSDGIEPKASLWKAMVTDRLELYANIFNNEAQRRAYVVDQTKSKALEHLQALYMQVPRLTGQQLVDQLAAIYHNPAEVDHARSQYEHWVMPNSNTRGNFLEWYREFRLLATQAEITDQQTLIRDLYRKISDFLARAVALHRADCRTVDDLAAKLIQVDELEVTIRERNRYRASRDTPPHVKKAPTANSTISINKNVANNPAVIPKPNYPPRMIPSGYSGTFKPNFTPNRPPSNPRSSATPAPGTLRTPGPRASAIDVGEVEQGTTPNNDQEEYHDAVDDIDPETYAEATNAAQPTQTHETNEHSDSVYVVCLRGGDLKTLNARRVAVCAERTDRGERLSRSDDEWNPSSRSLRRSTTAELVLTQRKLTTIYFQNRAEQPLPSPLPFPPLRPPERQPFCFSGPPIPLVRPSGPC